MAKPHYHHFHSAQQGKSGVLDRRAINRNGDLQNDIEMCPCVHITILIVRDCFYLLKF